MQIIEYNKKYTPHYLQLKIGLNNSLKNFEFELGLVDSYKKCRFTHARSLNTESPLQSITTVKSLSLSLFLLLLHESCLFVLFLQ